MKPLILDSALGTELENRGEYLPSFKTSIWSAYSLIHNPDVITQIHIDNIEAGADVITTSNYQATPELLKREPSAPSYDYLAKRAVELCQEAVIKTYTKTKIAGCFPPIHVTFRPDLTSKEKHLRKFYKTLGAIYQDNVDVSFVKLWHLYMKEPLQLTQQKISLRQFGYLGLLEGTNLIDFQVLNFYMM